MQVDEIRALIRDIPDWPNKGIIFKDITPLLRDKDGFRSAIDALAAKFEGEKIDLVLGAEARGFIVGAPLAYKLGAGFIPARKPGKLPHNTMSAEYELEYGTDSLELHEDAVSHGERVLVVDDVLATGGTAAAKIELVERLGGEVVAVAFLIELGFLNGRGKLGDHRVVSLIAYE